MTPFTDPLGALASPATGRSRRVSSNEQPNWSDGNFDMTPLPPGESVEFPLLQGPGVITHIWLTSHAGGVEELNALSLRIYWDGSEEPGVEAPLGDFFAVGQRPAVVESFPVQVSPTGSLTCYWRMPFAQSARIVVRNDNPDRTAGLYWQVDWTELDALPPDTPYFHARYRQEYPARAGRDYLLADLHGAGHYVGTVMTVTLAQDGWFGEGDDFFYIDGETVPSLQGTGTEDYFNDAWGYRPRTSLWFGQPRWDGDHAGDTGVCYRWHVLDAVRFTQSLRVTLEHKGNRADSVDGWFIERPDFFSSVAFWYQTGTPKPSEPLPGWHERRVPWIERHLLRSYREARSQAGTLRVSTQGFFGGRPVLAWEPAGPDARLELPFTVDEAGRYALRLTASVREGGSRYAVALDGEPLLETTFSAETPRWIDLRLGTRDLAGGAHVLSFRPASGSQTTGSLALERLRLLQLPPEAERAVKNHNEAHFVRLGIGRALYAYRLAYGELPTSLDELVRCGIMPERYLADENGHPLSARRDGEFFVAESTEGSWTGRWQGLDARR